MVPTTGAEYCDCDLFYEADYTCLIPGLRGALQMFSVKKMGVTSRGLLLCWSLVTLNT